MLAAFLLLQGSTLVTPMYLQDEPPEMRAMRMILVADRDVPGASEAVHRTHEEAVELASEIDRQLDEGGDFSELARRWSNHPSAKQGGAMGVYWPGMLGAEADDFLFAAAPFERSDPLPTPGGILILQRLDVEAGCLQLFIAGRGDDTRARAVALLDRLRAGEDFAQLAETESEDPLTAGRGGQLGIFVRGRNDRLVKAAVFAAEVGETVGPIETPLGYHVIRRVPPEQIDPALRDDVVARVRAIVVGRGGGVRMSPELTRSPEEAERIAHEVFERIRYGGEDMGDLAQMLNDDTGGIERRGDLGWILRGASSYSDALTPVFLEPVGTPIGPVDTNAGWVIALRER